jgi:carbon-monoxide dehydrogenase medium subunit
VKPASFVYHRPNDADATVRLLTELGDEAKIIAGGQSLVAMMNFRLARPTHLIDVGRIRGHRHVTADHAGLHIGALVTHHDIEKSSAQPFMRDYRLLRSSMRWIGHLPIRTRGTVGGSISHADATAEWCLLAILLDAQISVQGPHGTRTIAAPDFFFGYYSTALESNDFITEIRFPAPAPYAALTEHADRHGDFAVIATAVSLEYHPDGALACGRVAVAGASPAPVRVPEAETLLTGGAATDAHLFTLIGEAAADALTPPSDSNGSSGYRRQLIRVLVTRACVEAAAEASGERR